MPTKRHVLKALLAAPLAASPLLALRPARAQPWPSKPITVVVPFAAGGGVDSAARVVLTKLAELLKQPVVVENVAGAAGTIGTQKVARAAPDGHTLLFAVASPITVAPIVSPGAVRYDSFKDLSALSTVAVSPFVLIGKPALAAARTAELIRLAKAQPGKLNLGTDGVGTSLHITAELIKQRAGLDIVHVPYRSGPQVLADVAGGQLDLAVLPLTLALPFIRDGKVKAFGVTTRQRAAITPDLPALAETPELRELDVESWLGILGPANLPAEVVATLTQAIALTMKDSEVQRKLADIAARPLLLAGPAFTDYLQRERKTIQAIATSANIRAE